MTATGPCSNCGVANTPIWRKGLNNRVVCNACGLYFRNHEKPRPMEIIAGKRKRGGSGKKSASSASKPKAKTGKARLRRVRDAGNGDSFSPRSTAGMVAAYAPYLSGAGGEGILLSAPAGGGSGGDGGMSRKDRRRMVREAREAAEQAAEDAEVGGYGFTPVSSFVFTAAAARTTPDVIERIAKTSIPPRAEVAKYAPLLANPGWLQTAPDIAFGQAFPGNIPPSKRKTKKQKPLSPPRKEGGGEVVDMVVEGSEGVGKTTKESVAGPGPGPGSGSGAGAGAGAGPAAGKGGKLEEEKKKLAVAGKKNLEMGVVPQTGGEGEGEGGRGGGRAKIPSWEKVHAVVRDDGLEVAIGDAVALSASDDGVSEYYAVILGFTRTCDSVLVGWLAPGTDTGLQIQAFEQLPQPLEAITRRLGIRIIVPIALLKQAIARAVAIDHASHSVSLDVLASTSIELELELLTATQFHH